MSSTLIRIAATAACAVITLASCQEPSAPAQVTREATILAAASPTSITGVVGSAIRDLPSVIAQDANGTPTAGIVVTFAILSGGGLITGAVVTSNSAGIARLGAWTLGTLPGTSMVTATSGSLGSVTFSATAVAGPPTQLVKVAGDNQTVLAGAAVAIRPRVRVVDAYNNVLADVTVTFAVESGGGSATGTTVITDAMGAATIGGWTLGSRGGQSVVARSGSLAPALFTAAAFDRLVPCGGAVGLPAETMVRSELKSGSCKSSDGRFFEVYSVTLTDTTAYRFTLSTADFGTYVEIRDNNLTLLAGNNNRGSTVNSEVKALLPPGTYMLVATSFAADALGGYNVSFGKFPSSVDGCEEAFIARGVTTHQSVRPNDCLNSPEERADRFQIYLKAGSAITVQVQDLSYSGPGLELITPNGDHISAAQIGFYTASLSYTALVAGYYVINVTSTDENQYVLSVR